MQGNETFTKFILKQIAGTVAYNPVSHTFQLSLRNLSNTILETIYSEGAKWGMSKIAVDDYIASVINDIELSYQPSEQPVQFVDVCKDIKAGVLMTLIGRDKVRGLAKLCLLYLGASSKKARPQFLVLNSTRLGLIAEDIVEPADNTLWATGFRVLLAVFRNGRRFPNEESIYLTFPIEEIILTKPSVIHEIIDAKSEFRFREHTIPELDGAYSSCLTFGKNPMTLLLHEYSSKLPIYADFSDEGTGKYASNPDFIFMPTEMRNILFGVGDSYKERKLSIITTEKGEVCIDPETIQPKMTKGAKGKLSAK